MARTKVKYLDPDEILETIKHSFSPIIITEGDDDVIVWRRLEVLFYEYGLTLIPAGGRDGVLQVFRRRHEIPMHFGLMFIADQDEWVLKGVPHEYIGEDIFFSFGYSVENDMFIDGQLDELAVGPERARFNDELTQVIKWYALECSRLFRGADSKTSMHPKELLDTVGVKEAKMRLASGEVYPASLHARIKADPYTLLRGKTLFALLTRQCIGHNSRTLLNFGASRKGSLFQNIVNSTEHYLLNYKRPSAQNY